MTCRIDAEGNEYEMCFNNKRLGSSTILWGTIFPIGVILCDTIFPLSAILFDTILPLGSILFDAKWYDKEVGRTNGFGNIRNEKDLLVDSNDNRCWREERVWLNIEKDIAASGEIILREKMRDD